MLQEDKLSVERAEAEFEAKLMTSQPEMWFQIHGEPGHEVVTDDGVFMPSTADEFEQMLEILEREGWTPEDEEIV